MRFPMFVMISMAFSLVANAQPSRKDSVLTNLRKAYPAVAWNEKSVTLADVNCDGKPETILLGSEKSEVVIAIVSPKSQKKPQLFSFPISSATQNGFCRMPVRIVVSPLECESDSGPLPGCKPTRSCKEFTVADDECDGFNFYWDSSRKSLAWWRH